MSSLTERIAESNLRLKEWCKQPVNNEPRAHTWIHEIQLNFIKTWQINPREYHAHTPTIAWTSEDIPPPWRPLLSDCVDKFITGDRYRDKLIDILNFPASLLHPELYLPERPDKVELLCEPLQGWHIRWIKALCDDCEYSLFNGDIDLMDQDLNDNLLSLLEEDNTVRKELCGKGLQILDKVMDEQTLNEGDYVEMCNIFKELYN